MTRSRTRAALLALALGGFAIGATEFVAMGVLPEIARDLLPGVWAAGSEDAVAQAGALISAYALGVVVGAPTIAATLARFPRKRLLVGFGAAFTLGTLFSALAPTFEVALVARFVAGLPHGAYFGVAALVAGSLMGEGRRGRGVAFVMSGLAVANVVGVPLVTALGQNAGWRVAYLVIAGIFALATIAVLALVPAQPGDPGATIGRELRALRRPQVWFALGTGAIGFGGFFAVYSYISPLVTDVAGLPASAVPLVLVVTGVGMTIGTFAGGALADRGALRAVLLCFPAFIAVMVALGLTAAYPPALIACLVLMGGVTFALSPAIQTRLMDVAGESQTLAAALNHSSLNVGNSLGAALGATVIVAGYGYVMPVWVGVALAIAGLVIALIGVLAERGARRRAASVPPATGELALS